VNAHDDGLETTIRRVVGRFAPEADLDALDPDAPLQEALELDSMDFLNLMIAVHDETGVDVPEADYGRVATLADLVEYVRDRAGRP
jgi:acyl carrier protein